MSQIAVRVDEQLKKEATALFNELGLDMSTAVKLFLKQSVLTRSIPFKLALDEYSKEEVEQAKKDIQNLVEEKSEVVKLDFRRKEDVDVFFNN
ncbi:addiction module antitoxin, RelB/DinJ family [Streptococcus infantis SK1076]|uniref:Addiction module antitoxin, RelB/DinJ family n=1 Tax=Streptococcus infantis SK1076 TaxID=1005705 RepID=F5VXW4_9STRE|nr:type II toxin-antitoxin system RelB/DinJ family antitoxin [Streptococcus infantis]EGL88284.1 addiction module antitoxin, RelB/DinJ family [Streptococcus infantis SK1076]